MPVKRRLPKAKAFVPSAELLDLYRRALELKASGRHREPSPFSEDGHPSEQYSALWHRIHDLCGFTPWNQSVLDVLDGDTSDFAARASEIKPIIEAALLEHSYNSPPPKEQRVNGQRTSSNAARQAAWRQRQKLCKIVVPIEVEEHALAEALISSRWLTANETQDREQVARAVGEIVAEWTMRWI